MTVIGLEEFIGHGSQGLEPRRGDLPPGAVFSSSRASLPLWGLAAVALLRFGFPFASRDAVDPPRDRPSEAPKDAFSLNLGARVMDQAWDSALARIRASGHDPIAMVERAGKNLSLRDTADDAFEDDEV